MSLVLYLTLKSVAIKSDGWGQGKDSIGDLLDDKASMPHFYALFPLTQQTVQYVFSNLVGCAV